MVLATGRVDRRGDLLAAAGGLLYGVGLLLSYGLVLAGLVPLGVAWRRRSVRPLVIAAIGATVAPILFWLFGFSWFDGLAATGEQYDASVASTRPYRFFFVSNLAALAVVIGPAVTVGLFALRDRAMWLLVGGALAAVAVANLSGMSKGEVERIWLPFAVWLLPAGAAAGRARWALRAAWPWLLAQVGVALAVESLLHTRW
ncbi:MAG: hypothetical protein U5R31_02770 [Acidimicrobiia bacterium]|nr:hypothetical protein [Acidimicrobiia bacterium]